MEIAEETLDNFYTKHSVFKKLIITSLVIAILYYMAKIFPYLPLPPVFELLKTPMFYGRYLFPLLIFLYLGFLIIYLVIHSILRLKENYTDVITHTPLVLFICIGLFLLSFYMSKPTGNFFLNQATVKAKPLIKAINSYHKENDTFPSSLSQLVPQYIDKIPQTGMLGCREYEYSRLNEGKAYRLRIRMIYKLDTIDDFCYRSDQNYREEFHSDYYEKIIDWASCSRDISNVPRSK